MKFKTCCRADTVALGKRLGEWIENPVVIAFRGDLGVGKTAFISGLAKGIGFVGETSSPTFAIVNLYEGGKMPLYHFDMYRVNGWEDLETTGYFDGLEQNCVMAVEWSENIYSALPDERIDVTITRLSDNEREIEIGGIKGESFSG